MAPDSILLQVPPRNMLAKDLFSEQLRGMGQGAEVEDVLTQLGTEWRCPLQGVPGSQVKGPERNIWGLTPTSGSTGP